MGKAGSLRRWVLRLVISPSRKRSHDSLLMSYYQQVDSYHVASAPSCHLDLDPIQTGHVEVYVDGELQRCQQSAHMGHVAGGKCGSILNGHMAMSRTPRGHVAVYVGEAEERFLVPIAYLSHPHLDGLLRRSEMEFGFQHTAGLRIPCTPSEFHHTLTLIHSEPSFHAPCIPFPKSRSLREFTHHQMLKNGHPKHGNMASGCLGAGGHTLPNEQKFKK